MGEIAPLTAVTLDDVRRFHETYYRPRNASIAVAGGFDADAVWSTIERCFGPLPATPRTDRVWPSPRPLDDERRVVVEDDVEASRVYLAWLTTARFGADEADLATAARLLLNGRTGRLHRRVVHRERLAVELSGGHYAREIAGFFQISVTPAPGRALTDVARAMQDEIARLGTEGPTAAEMERCRIQLETDAVLRRQRVGGAHGIAAQLNAYGLYTGEPARLSTDVDRYRAVTADSVRQAVRHYLDRTERVTLCVVPRRATPRASGGGAGATQES